MSLEIHPAASVAPGAQLASGVRVGPNAVIGPEVVIGENTEVGAGAQVEGPSRLGAGNRIFPFACIGFDPQDLKYEGERTELEVGDGNIFREFCTVHRGTGQGGGVTSIGDRNLFMAYTHVAHDSRVGSRTVFSNSATLAGHVVVEDDAVIGAFSAVRQFCRVGRHAYIGGYSVLTKDVLPFAITVGLKPAVTGLNRVGLERKGFNEEAIKRLESALRLLTRSGLNTQQALDRIRAELSGDPDIDYFVDFVAGSERGVIKSLPGRRGARGSAPE